jgi:TolA-binding protein
MEGQSDAYFATSRSVTVIRQHQKDMTKEEIVRAKDAVIRGQKQRIDRMRRRIAELKDALFTANHIQALTMGVLELSLEPGAEDLL